VTVLAGAQVVTADDVLDPGWVRVVDGRIADVGARGVLSDGSQPVEECYDLAGMWLVPGMVDLHVHGGGGASYTEGNQGEALAALAYHRAGGTTTSFASLVTAAPSDLVRAIASMAELVGEQGLAGIHLEGPFLARSRCGAQAPEFLLEPDVALLRRLLEAGRGTVAMVTVAPELDGAVTLVREIVDAGAIAAIGHSDATYDQAISAIDAGARVATHLFNGMRPRHHREPGIAGAALDSHEVTCELIADGQHLHPATLREAFAAAAGRVSLVTDAISAAGAGDGTFRLGPATVTVVEGRAHLDGREVVAGSTITTGAALRHAVQVAHLPIAEVVRAGAARPAWLLGRGAETGSIEKGKLADIVVLDPELQVVGVMARGDWLVRPVAPRPPVRCDPGS
jgi:N-acetylglucosamine-6-phosphate deacetylase